MFIFSFAIPVKSKLLGQPKTIPTAERSYSSVQSELGWPRHWVGFELKHHSSCDSQCTMEGKLEFHLSLSLWKN